MQQYLHESLIFRISTVQKNSRQILRLKSKQKQKLERWLVSLKFARKNNQKVEFYLLLKDRMPIAKISTFCTLVALLFSPSMSDLGSANLPFILKTRERGGFCSSIRSKDESWNINIKRNLWWRRKLYTYQLPQKKPMAQCSKIIEKVAVNIASEASYVYILSGQKLIKNAKNG